jgi:hypothetical protein
MAERLSISTTTFREVDILYEMRSISKKINVELIL